MAAFELLLSQARCHFITRPPSTHSLLFLLRLSPLLPSSSSPSTFVGFYRRFCWSSSSPHPETPPPQSDESTIKTVETIPIQVIAYPVKPEDPSNSEAPHPPPPSLPPQERHAGPVATTNAVTHTWTREDIRYVKDAPSISPVSYPTKSAPLPEDRTEVSAEVVETDSKEVKLEREGEKIQDDHRTVPQIFKPAEKVPFPTLIKFKSNEPKVALDLVDAVRLVKTSGKKRKFLETVEAHAKLAVDLRRTDMTVRGSVMLPHGTGKAIRVAVFAEGADADEARAAGADIVGGLELVEEIKNTKKLPDVDRCISTELFMGHLKKISMVLRAQMPSPRRGTVTNDIAGAVKEARRGLIDFRMDNTAIVHVGLGKITFSEEALQENIAAFLHALLLAKPAGLKKTSKFVGYLTSFHLCSSMGPGIRVSIQSLSRTADRHRRLHQQ